MVRAVGLEMANFQVKRKLVFFFEEVQAFLTFEEKSEPTTKRLWAAHKNGEGGWARTNDQAVMSRLL